MKRALPSFPGLIDHNFLFSEKPHRVFGTEIDDFERKDDNEERLDQKGP